jgi:hypothetical protein
MPARRLRGRVVWLILFGCVFTSVAEADIVQNTVENYLRSNQQAGNKANSLINQNSPYLLQHAYNPVQWYAWGEEAFELAREQDKPVFLSIGYSTCYWCHVMAHESFENEAIANILNKYFIAIKLDREERPDIDNVYMAATELVNGYGGWPMTVFLNHELEPFHAGVYYPPVSTDSTTGLTELLLRINDLWHKDRARINMVAGQVTAQIKAAADQSTDDAGINKDIRERAVEQIADIFDDEYGGFSAAPKFPRPGIFMLLLDIAASGEAGSKQALMMIRDTLIAMSQGGIYDHVGGGFHRYSVDAQWQVPHFEKMLYTQALMSLAYTRLYEIEPDQRYRDVVAATLRFTLSEMRHSGGAFYSALDASSERSSQPGDYAEGAYYLWRAEEIERALNSDEWQFARDYFSIMQPGNIYSDPRDEFEQLNILHISDEFRHRELTDGESALISRVKQKLYAARLQRPRPHLDDKIITAWNGMMITALVEAARVFDDKRYLDAAISTADFLQHNLVDKRTNQLYRRIRADRAGINATLDDYVWYINGLLNLSMQTNDKQWLSLAERLAAKQQQLFQDRSKGGYYESGADKNLLFRSRSAYDGALPAPNAIAIENLQLLARLTGEKAWLQMAMDALGSFAVPINNDPAAAAWMLSLLDKRQR